MLCNSSLSIQWNYIYFQQMAHKILFYLWMRWSLTINNCINTENIIKSLYGRAILFNILSKIYLYLALKLNKKNHKTYLSTNLLFSSKTSGDSSFICWKVVRASQSQLGINLFHAIFCSFWLLRGLQVCSLSL